MRTRKLPTGKGIVGECEKFFYQVTECIQRFGTFLPGWKTPGVVVREVEITQLEEHQIFLLRKIIKQKLCYNNAWCTLSRLPELKDGRYVLGYVLVCGVPIEHAWVKAEDKYYDPTEQVVFGSRDGLKYFSLVELDRETLFDLTIENHNIPPSFRDWYVLTREGRRKAQ